MSERLSLVRSLVQFGKQLLRLFPSEAEEVLVAVAVVLAAVEAAAGKGMKLLSSDSGQLGSLEQQC